MDLKREIAERLTEVGAVAVGICLAEPVDEGVMGVYEEWVLSGKNAGMKYMGNHIDLRRDPRLLLEGAKSIICAGFCYRPTVGSRLNPRVAKYAHLPDYHDWVRERVLSSGVGELLGEEYRDWRLCIDTAPILERYWARRAGLGWIGMQGALVIPGVGPEVVLCEILTTTALSPDGPLGGDCGRCGKCVAACPTGAIRGDGNGPDCNLCISYLTIEHRGAWEDERHLRAMETAAGRASLFGCDRCMSVCPHNNPEITSGQEADSRIIGLSAEDLRDADFGVRFRGLAIKRAKAAGLQRNGRLGEERGERERREGNQMKYNN
ncbi:MAG: DUF1730 domain-containing protein [Muribaculaceae bacterium]|nr:DUF1730 domain-containing protein [Muribaculaceae bacterium]